VSCSLSECWYSASSSTSKASKLNMAGTVLWCWGQLAWNNSDACCWASKQDNHIHILWWEWSLAWDSWSRSLQPSNLIALTIKFQCLWYMLDLFVLLIQTLSELCSIFKCQALSNSSRLWDLVPLVDGGALGKICYLERQWQLTTLFCKEFILSSDKCH